jgi:hypothetical protein
MDLVTTSVVMVKVYAMKEGVPEPVMSVGKRSERACEPVV